MAESIDFAIIDMFSMIQVVAKNSLIIYSFKRGELLAMIRSILFHFLKDGRLFLRGPQVNVKYMEYVCHKLF